MNETDDELFNRASRNWKDGDLEGALSIITDLISRGDGVSAELAAYYVLRGGVYQELGIWSAASADFKQLVSVKPSSRLASALYYNSLIETENLAEANSEGLRYLAIIESCPELTEDTQSYVDTILYNLCDSEDWSRDLLPKEIELVLARQKAED